MRQCWPAVSIANHMWARLRAFSGSQYFYGTPLEQVILHALSSLVLGLKPFSLPAFPFLWVGLGRYLKTFHCSCQCDGAWWLPLTGLS